MRWLVVIALCAHAAAAEPWDADVPKAEQDKAKALFNEGNQLFAERAHALALDKYREAVKHWDHPLINFNLAVTLIRLDRALEAGEALERALRYEAAPFTKELYQQALDYQALLKGRIGFVRARCELAGARVVLDGKPWFECPGTKTERVLAGEHLVVAQLAGYLTSSERLAVNGGVTVDHSISLIPLERAVTLSYPYPRWIPWTVTGGGAAIALGGLAFWLNGRDNLDEYKQQLQTTCPAGCPIDGDQYRMLRDMRDAALQQGTIGVAMMSVGGALVVGGVVLAILDRPKRVLPKVEVAPRPGGVVLLYSPF